MNGATGIYLPETNEAYEAWVGQNPHGYVINLSQSAAMYWHRADCPHIEPAVGWRFVGGGLMKACALDPGELAEWAKQRPDALHYCKDCRWKWGKDHATTA